MSPRTDTTKTAKRGQWLFTLPRSTGEIPLALRLLARGRARHLTDPADLEAGARLRAEVFDKELRWVRASESGTEVDAYDATAVGFGVFLGRECVAYGRVLRSDGPFMLEREFASMVDGVSLHKDAATVELSRVALAPRLRGTAAGMIAKVMLWRVLVGWCRKNGIRYWYMVTSRTLFERLSAAYVVEQVGRELQFDGGPPIIASRSDIVASFEKRARTHPWEAALFRSLYEAPSKS
jgi:N-acyl-L-homoserine lactone synthetase